MLDSIVKGYYVYILWSPSADRFYIGQTAEIKERVGRHNKGFESSTAPYAPWTLLWTDIKENRAEAMKLEAKLKNLSRDRLEKFMLKYSEGARAAERLGLVS